ncbi:MAG: precorrin-4 C(11)-methyltransferase [Eubacterium sp.]|nr:precorrin-4 C(11)-methyltransferase [Eubacterium sp.]
MVHFVGAGPGAKDLITVRGKELIEAADVIIYAGSLVNPELLEYAGANCRVFNSAYMTLDEVIGEMKKAKDETLVRLHTGDPSLYGAIKEQMDILDELGIEYDVTPGVSAAFGAAASLGIEYTLPSVSQSLIITRMEGKTKVPKKESIEAFASHGASMAVYLSAGMLEELSERLIKGGYDKNEPAAIVYKATWDDEKKYLCTVETLAQTAEKHGITKTAVILVGKALSAGEYEKSKLYSPDFETEFRKKR